MNNNAGYKVNLITDIPASKDEFGAHKRVTDAIAELIDTQDGGISIGLEGGWGSGKSTVVNLLKEKWDKQQDHSVIVFDAWAHQGDPLRRTFLENAIKHLEKLKWIDTERWEKRRAELAQRRKVIDQKSIPRLGKLGGLLALSVLLIPVGLAFLNAGLRTPITSVNSIDWMVILGIGTTFIPVGLLLLSLLPRGWNSFQNWRQGKTIAEDDTSTNFGALIAQKYITDTRTETTENPNPTSVEFEEMFATLMGEALNGQSRRLILVLDNLDRVTAADALSILASLQTFLKYSDYSQPEWFKKLYVLIPYDPKGLQRLWKAQNEDENSKITTAFLDKMFQIRFEVPPLLLSDLRSYLMGLLKRALPNHSADEFHSTYRVFALENRNGVSPTPRDLKLFVNQIGTINRQWTNTFPLAHVAYYVLLRRRGKDIPQGLLAKALPEENFAGLLGDKAQENLAAMAFNAPVEQALQLLLRAPLEDALSLGNVDRLKELSGLPGFWEVMLDIPFSDWAEKESLKLANAAYGLGENRLIDKAEPHLAKTVIRSLADAAASVETWTPFDTNMAKGITSLLQLSPNESLAAQILQGLAAIDEKETDAAKNWVGGFIYLLRGMQAQNLQDVYAEGVVVTAKVEGYIELCTQLYSQDRKQEFWEYIRPRGEVSAVLSALEDTFKADTLSHKHVNVMQVMQAGRDKPSWNTFTAKIAERIQTVDPIPASTLSSALEALWELYDFDSTVDPLIGNLATKGHLLHHLYLVRDNADAAAWCAFMFLFKVPAATQPPTLGNSDDGYNFLISEIFAKPASYELFTDNFADRLSYRGNFDLLFQILDATPASKAWILECLKAVETHKNTLRLITPQILFDRWQFLQAELPEADFNHLVEVLIGEANLLEFLSNKDFEPEKANAYLIIARNGAMNDTRFHTWSQEGLGALNSGVWESELKSEGYVLRLLIELLENGAGISLGSSYQDALAAQSRMVITGQSKPDQLAAHWKTLLKPLNLPAINFLRSQLLDVAGQADGKIAPEFFDLYGTEIADNQALAEDRNVVMRLFVPLVRERNERGLQWIADTFVMHPDILTHYSDTHVDNFRNRIQEVLDGSEEEISEGVSRLASHLNLHRTVPPAADTQE